LRTICFILWLSLREFFMIVCLVWFSLTTWKGEIEWPWRQQGDRGLSLPSIYREVVAPTSPGQPEIQLIGPVEHAMSSESVLWRLSSCWLLVWRSERIKFNDSGMFEICQFSWNMNERSSYSFFSRKTRHGLRFTPDLRHGLPMLRQAFQAYSVSAPPWTKDAKIDTVKIDREGPNRQSGHQNSRIFGDGTVYIGAFAQWGPGGKICDGVGPVTQLTWDETLSFEMYHTSANRPCESIKSRRMSQVAHGAWNRSVAEIPYFCDWKWEPLLFGMQPCDEMVCLP
jgi:hypothetical protein